MYKRRGCRDHVPHTTTSMSTTPRSGESPDNVTQHHLLIIHWKFHCNTHTHSLRCVCKQISSSRNRKKVNYWKILAFCIRGMYMQCARNVPNSVSENCVSVAYIQVISVNSIHNNYFLSGAYYKLQLFSRSYCRSRYRSRAICAAAFNILQRTFIKSVTTKWTHFNCNLTFLGLKSIKFLHEIRNE